ncbi:MAG: hypothetical protein KDJ35_04570 [Alphaproteobacteria bacterium]|nr:hypothetical protein [Alphaproteobacteria bacterium]
MKPISLSFMRKWVLLSLAAAFVFTSVAVMFPKKSEACCSCITTTTETETEDWPINVYGRTLAHVWLRFEIHKRLFMRAQWWGNHMAVALRDMVEELSGVAMQQTLIIGSFMDASYQMETQQVLQTLQARAHKDYHPSVGMCEFISNAKSLADSSRKGEMNQIVMAQRSQDRVLGNAYTSAGQGRFADMRERVEQFKTKFCDPKDHAGGLALMCGTDNHTPEQRARMNKDIDYTRTVDYPYTLDVDFTDNTQTNEEEEIMALAANLYNFDVFERPNAEMLTYDPERLTGIQKNYMDARSVLAKMSVAENSFNAITGMKSAGAPGAKEFIEAVFEQLNISPEEIEQLVGEQPSYYAQMEILTKKLLQNPDFYTNLYDKPTNIERKGTALQAIGLMQKFDLFKSHLRNEANLSMLLELAVKDVQQDIENDINREASDGGNPAN